METTQNTAKTPEELAAMSAEDRAEYEARAGQTGSNPAGAASQSAATQAASASRGRGRPSNAERAESAEITAMRARLAELEAREAATREQNRQRIEARTNEDDETEGPGVWARFIGNPRTGGEGPDYTEMYGYGFERNGQFVLVKGDPAVLSKFQGNGEFQTEYVEDASDLADGATRDAPKTSDDKRRAGKVGKVSA